MRFKSIEYEFPESRDEISPWLFNGIPHGLLEEGFPYLGSPEASVTLIDYSDFL
jgi:hypothetical protein